MISSQTSIDTLWLDTLNRISGRAAHELKGVLNGVSVNLEVVRSRASKPDAPASAVASFANSASTQFDAVMDMTEALLFLSRATSGPSDVGKTARLVGALLGPVARVDGHSFTVDGNVDSFGASTADGRAVRLAVGAIFLGAVESGRDVTCKMDGGGLAIVATEGELVLPGDDVMTALRDAGIGIQAERSAISITFPR